MVGNSNRDSEFPARKSPMHCKRRVVVLEWLELPRAMGDGGARDDGGARLADVAHFTTKWYVESGGLVRGSYSGRRLRVAVGVQRRSEGEKDIQCEVRAAREQGDTLEVHGHRLGQKGVEALAAELRADQKIRKLVLCDTTIGPGGAGPLAEMLLQNQCITDITLQLNGLGDRGACAIAHGLASGSTCNLRSLALEEEGIGEAGITAIAAALSPRGARGPALALLEKLSLRGNPVSTPGAGALARALRLNTTLERLDLSSCSLSGLGAARLAEALPHNCTLLELRLVRNGIPVAGAIALASGLLHNEGLESLHLGANPCGSEAWLGFPMPDGRRSRVAGLVQAISSPPLINLSLFGTGLGNAGIAEMAVFLVDSRCKLESLDLGDNRLSCAGAIELSKVLPKQTTITTLGLWGNFIGSAGKPDADALARSIQRNKCLVSVSLHGNPIEHRSGPMAIIQRAMIRNQKHAAHTTREEELRASAVQSYLSRSSSRGSSRSLNSATAIDLTGSDVSTTEKPDLVPALALPTTRRSGQGEQRKPGVTLGVPGQTPREVRELDANGRTGRTPRPVEVQTDTLETNASVSPTETAPATATAASFRQKLLQHHHQSNRLLQDEHDIYVQEVITMARTQSTVGDDQVSPDKTSTAVDDPAPEASPAEAKPEPRPQKRKLRTPVLPTYPPRSEATPTSVGLVTSAAGKAARSVTVFIDNQTTMPLVLADKHIGPKDGRWTWSDRLVPACVRQNEQVVMASESIGGTSRERRPIVATRAAATVMYRLESEIAEKFRGVLRLEGIAAVANAALTAAVRDAQKDHNEPGVDENATLGVLIDALAEAASSMRVVVRRDQVQIRCRHRVAYTDVSESASAQTVTGWLGFAADGTMIWRSALPGERIVEKKAPATSDQKAPATSDQVESEPQPQPEPEPQPNPEPQPEPQLDLELGFDAKGPEPAETYDWQPKLLEDLGYLEILSDSGEDGVMSLTFLVDGGAVASLLRPAVPDQTSPGTGSRTNRPSSPKDINPNAAISPTLAQRLVDALIQYGPDWLSSSNGCPRESLQAVEVQVMPGYKAPAPQSCSVELSWAHDGRQATAKWIVKHCVERQDLAVQVSVAGAGSASKNFLSPYVGEEYSQSTKEPHLQISFTITPAKSMRTMVDAAVAAEDDSSESSEYIVEDESQSPIGGAEPVCTPPSAHLVAQLRHVRTSSVQMYYTFTHTLFGLSESFCKL